MPKEAYPSLRILPSALAETQGTTHAVTRSVGYMSLILFYMANSFHLSVPPVSFENNSQTIAIARKDSAVLYQGPIFKQREGCDNADIRKKR